jgi:xanthine dehydrogenase accessory factor
MAYQRLKTHSNSNVIQTTLNWLKQGKPVWLSTITKTWGSSPMPAGTLMAYCSGNGMVGSLSGGCIEQDLLDQMEAGSLGSSNENQVPVELIYGQSEEDQKKFLLPCGGQLHLLVERLSPSEASIQHFTELNTRLSQRTLICRKVCLKTGFLDLQTFNVKRGIVQVEQTIEHGLGPVYQMLLIGASEVARCVAELALPLDFKVAVWDHREAFIRNWQVENVEVFSGSPEKLISQNYHDQNNAIIALAHDPRVDDFALVDALDTNAFYIGAIGSKKTCANRNKRLLEYISEPKNLQKMHSPVGLSIGSKTPYEIAISILAEIISKRSQLENITKTGVS